MSSWDTPNAIPEIKLKNPPIKDTIVVPSGGYVVIRFKAKNPGLWFFHSQVDLYTTYGMAMILQVGPVSESPMLDNPQTCWIQRQTGGDNQPQKYPLTLSKQLLFYLCLFQAYCILSDWFLFKYISKDDVLAIGGEVAVVAFILFIIVGICWMKKSRRQVNLLDTSQTSSSVYTSTSEITSLVTYRKNRSTKSEETKVKTLNMN